MVVLLTLTVKNIRGEEFEIDVDRDADVLGLKVQIWEMRSIPVNKQRLIFAGRELQDNLTLNASGVGNNSTIFMVETGSQEAAQQQPQATFQPLPQQQMPVNVVYQQPPIAAPVVIPVPDVAINSSGARSYQPLDPVAYAEEQTNNIYDLAWWIRFYAIACILILILLPNTFVPCLLYIIGWIGTRNLNRCNLGIFAATLCILSLALTVFPIVAIAHQWHSLLMIIPLLFGFLHWCIFVCVVRFTCRVGRLSQPQKEQVRARIAKYGVLW